MKLELSTHNEYDIVGHVSDFLNDPEIDAIWKANSQRKWQPGVTRYSGYNSKIRKCLKIPQINFQWWDRLMMAVQEYNKHSYNLHLNSEREKSEVNLVRYNEPGMFFRPHRDYRPILKDWRTRGDIRKISCSIQLSYGYNYKGSDLEIVESYTVPGVYMDSNFPPDFIQQREKFRHRFKTIRKKGSLTMFTSIHEHESTPLISGQRDIVVAFISGKSQAI